MGWIFFLFSFVLKNWCRVWILLFVIMDLCVCVSFFLYIVWCYFSGVCIVGLLFLMIVSLIVEFFNMFNVLVSFCCVLWLFKCCWEECKCRYIVLLFFFFQVFNVICLISFGSESWFICVVYGLCLMVFVVSFVVSFGVFLCFSVFFSVFGVVIIFFCCIIGVVVF